MAEEWDGLVADLHDPDAPEFATGHGVSAEWESVAGPHQLGQLVGRDALDGIVRRILARELQIY